MKMQIAFVLWTLNPNKVMSGGWMTRESLSDIAKQKTDTISSIGFVSIDCPEYIVITQNMGENISGITKIVRESIVEMKIIGEINVE